MAIKLQKIENIYIQYRQALLNYILRFLPYADAEDVLQDVFYQLYKGYEQIKSFEEKYHNIPS